MWDGILTELRLEILVRVALALAVSIILGIERERHGRAAGLRTTVLVCLSSCVVMMLSDLFCRRSLAAPGATPGWHPDPMRLAAGALSGMGFLGAGVIIRQSSHVIRGVTTAATLWFATVIGLALGAGAIGIGILAFAIAFAVLYWLPALESHIHDDWYSDLSVGFDAGASSVETILRELKSFPIKVKSMDIHTSRQHPLQRVLFHLKYKRRDLIRFPIEVTERVGGLPGVQETHWHA